MKRTLPAILIAFTLNSFAQNPTEWGIYFENDTVKIEYSQQNCIYTDYFNNEYVILEITNKIDEELTINWQEQLWYDENCTNCELDSAEFRKETKMDANQTISGNCKTSNHLRIFSKFTEKIEDMPGVNKILVLSKFELQNLTITYNEN